MHKVLVTVRIFAFEIEPDEEFIEAHDIETVELNRLLQESDFISIHTPLLDDTRDLIGKQEIERMKPDAFLKFKIRDVSTSFFSFSCAFRPHCVPESA